MVSASYRGDTLSVIPDIAFRERGGVFILCIWEIVSSNNRPNTTRGGGFRNVNSDNSCIRMGTSLNFRIEHVWKLDVLRIRSSSLNLESTVYSLNAPANGRKTFFQKNLIGRFRGSQRLIDDQDGGPWFSENQLPESLLFTLRAISELISEVFDFPPKS